MLRVIFALAFVAVSTLAARADTLSAPEAATKLDKGEILLVDVRSPGEWASTGAPDGANRITIHNKRGPVAFAQRLKGLAAKNPGKRMVFICARGNRSSAALRIARAHGLTNVAHVPEGMVGSTAGPGWIARGLPIDRNR